MANVKGFIFDLDGVLTETSEQHYLAWKKLAKELKIEIDRKFNEKLKGVSRLNSLELILEYGNKQNDFTEEEKISLATRKNQYYVNMIKSFTENNLFAGVLDIFNELKKLNIKIAIGSASKNAPRLLKAMKINQYIDYIVDPATITHGKPAPDIFLKAAEGLSLYPNECIGIEDAFFGIEAIESAGMFAIGIGNATILKDANLIYSTINDINLEEVFKIFRGHINVAD